MKAAFEKTTRIGRTTALCLALLVTLLALALGGVADAKALKADSAKGSGTIEGGKFSFSANDTDGEPATDEAKGKFSFKVGGVGSFKGEVSCLRVEGTLATFKGVVTKADGEFEDFEGATLDFDVTDSGQRGGEGDLSGFEFSGAPEACDAPTGGFVPIEKGDIKVVDAEES